jgi:hypothetical protein
MMRRPKHRIQVLLAGLLVAGWPAGGAAAPAKARAPSSYVLIVAHNNSLDPHVKPLKFADDDGARYWELFSDTGAKVALLSVLDPETARTHPEAASAARVPWMRNLVDEVERIRKAVIRDNRAGRRTRFTFVYVGHGNVAKNGEGYVNLQDVKLRRRDLFSSVVDQVPAGTVHLIIDACKSYFLVSRGPGDWRDDRSGNTYRDEARAFLAEQSLESHPHVGAILSTSGDEEVHEWSAFRSGIFSHQVRSALSGAADINGDGKVEYSEVAAFIAAANYRVSLARARIRPHVIPPRAYRHAVLVDLTRGRQRVLVELARDDHGRFTVEDERGVRYADLNKAPGPMRLWLPAHHRFFIRNGDLEYVVAPNLRDAVALASLPSGPARSDPRGAVEESFRNNLFSLPFSRSFYEGYLATSELPSVDFSARAPNVPLYYQPRISLDLGYALSGPVQGTFSTVYGHSLQHSVALQARVLLRPPFYVAARAEFGVSSGQVIRPEKGNSTFDSTLYRIAALGGAGLRWNPGRRVELALQADVGYQALIFHEVVQENGNSGTTSSPAGIKFGSMLQLTYHPWQRVPRLGLVLRGGFYGHVFWEKLYGAQVTAIPEGGAAVSYGF